jgi:gas vesicle protein
MADDYRCCNSGTVFLAFVMGAAIGGGLALLTAPRSGEETRNKVRGMADDVRQRIKDIAAEAEAKIKETIEEGREVLQEKKEIVKSAVEAGKEAMEAERAKHQKPV